MRWTFVLTLWILDIVVAQQEQIYFNALQNINFENVKQDIREMLQDSKDFFPADYGYYGPFMVRMAWHCAGTYRKSDGEGGCGGGRQRFLPERGWVDNTNLDKAETLMQPIKDKYGVGLSWGDLMILTGDVALEEMGVPILGFCAGRVDNLNGDESLALGPSDLQEAIAPCPDDGDCQAPLGAALLDHIYVDAGGYLGNPDPKASVDPIRDVFERMGMNDLETVALIGGGHTFGKTHGSCPGGAGPTPVEDMANPWPFPNECGANPSNITTSGFEGPWSTTPLTWSTSYFDFLLGLDWEPELSPSGNNQFKPVDDIFLAPISDSTFEETIERSNLKQGIRMLVTDLAFLEDPKYKAIAESLSEDIDYFAEQFSLAWYKLTTRDMGPRSRCFGDNVPLAQQFQAELPEPYSSFEVLSELRDIANTFESTLPEMVEIAYLCASTFRKSDYFGGCNGGRIRAQPEAGWPSRMPLEEYVQSLSSEVEGLDVSEADSIVFVATQLLQNEVDEFSDENFVFCPLRSDVPADKYQAISEDIVLLEFSDKSLQHQRNMRLLGLTLEEYIVLQLRPRSELYYSEIGYSGVYPDAEIFSNSLSVALIEEDWTLSTPEITGMFGKQYENSNGDSFITEMDYMLLMNYRDTLEVFASDEEQMYGTFINAWTKLMNIDRFDGPVENLCTNGKVEVINLGLDTGDNDRAISEAGLYTSVFLGSIAAVIVLIGLIIAGFGATAKLVKV